MFQAGIKMIGGLFTRKPDEIVRNNMRAAMHEAVQLGVRRVKGRTPQGVTGAQGGLLGSIQGEVREPAGEIIGIIGTPSKYGLVVEKGRKPGGKMPPKGVLRRWVEVKMGASGKEADRIEFLVRRKIARKGTKAAAMFEQTMAEDLDKFQNIFERYGVRLTKELSQ